MSIQLDASRTRPAPTVEVLIEIADERARQDEKWGEQNHPDGCCKEYYEPLANEARAQADEAAEDGVLTWVAVLLEEVYEAVSETDYKGLREELIQVAAVAAAWVESIDRRAA